MPRPSIVEGRGIQLFREGRVCERDDVSAILVGRGRQSRDPRGAEWAGSGSARRESPRRQPLGETFLGEGTGGAVRHTRRFDAEECGDRIAEGLRLACPRELPGAHRRGMEQHAGEVAECRFDAAVVIAPSPGARNLGLQQTKYVRAECHD